MRLTKIYQLNDVDSFKLKMLNWANQFERVCCLNSNSYTDDKYSFLLGVDVVDELVCSNEVSDAFSALKDFHAKVNDWLFGFFTYDLKNQIEELVSDNFDGINMPDMHFFQPKYVFIFNMNELQIAYLKNVSSEEDVDRIYNEINSYPLVSDEVSFNVKEIKSRISKKQYLEALSRIKDHLQYGDIYEMNFCQEFYAEDVDISPLQFYVKLNGISSSPFSCYYRLNDKYLASASPERFLKKINNRLITQPIKGTIRRGTTPEEDELLKQQLYNSPKERSENVMIVDVARNDLSRTAARSSVKVEELFGIYTFKQVHQMISTISSELREDVHFVDAIKNAFPMASMTGAPKIRAMQIIEQCEETKRGLYSGSVGYITLDNDFDFNVVIRSALYNATKKYFSFMVGGAITSKSIPEDEYEECLLKAKAVFEVLKG